MEYLDNKHNIIGDTDKQKKSQSKTSIFGRPETKKEADDRKHKGNKSKDGPKKSKKKFFLPRVSLMERILLVDNLSTMLRAGLSLAPALETLAKETKNSYLKYILDTIRGRVENGQLLSKGMLEFPKVFSEMIVASVEVGESVGMLPDTLANLSARLKAQKALRSKVLGALMYPSIVLLALVAVSLLLALFVFPQLVTIFEESGVELPFTLRAVQYLTFILTNYYLYLIGGFIALIILFKFIFRLPRPRYILHGFFLRIPFAGNIIKEMNLTLFAGNLHTLLASGLAIVQAMGITAKTLGNLRYRNATHEIAKALEKGVALDKAMQERPFLFPTLAVQLCQVGAKTGELEQILEKVEEYYENRVNNVLANLAVIIEPVLLIVVGVVVGFIAVSVIGPIYELTLSFAE